MSAICLLLLALGTGPGNAGPRSIEPPQTGTVFATLTVELTGCSGSPAGWQLEVEFSDPRVRIVGIEGVAGTPWRVPPHHDAAALKSGHLRLLALAAAGEAAPPGPQRLARLHLAHPEGASLAHEIRGVVVGDAEGKRLRASIRCQEEKR